MPSIVKSTIRSEIAKGFYKSLESRTTQLYYSLGRITPWSQDLIPPSPESSGLYEKDLRENIIRLQQVALSNTSLMTLRHNWTPGEVYDMYDPRSSTVELAQARMFILTDDFNVYKCIFNNYGAPSTVKPTDTSVNYVTEADGYTWKYMKTLNSLERSRYLTSTYIPVSDVIGAGFFSGSIQNVSIINGGSGYHPNNTLLQVIGDGSTEAQIDPIISGGVITGFTIREGGSNYTQADILITTPDPGLPQGTGAILSPVISSVILDNNQAAVQLAAVDGQISSIFINSGGTGYTTATAVIEGDGTGALITPVIEGGAITKFNFTNRGSGYTSATVVVSGDGSGFSADVILAPEGGHGFSLVNESYPSAIMVFLPDIDSEILGMRTSDISYRQISLLTNPYRYNSDSRFFGDSGTPCWLIEKPTISTSAFSAGDILREQTTSNIMRVVSVEAGKMLVQITSSFLPTTSNVFDKIDIDNTILNLSALDLNGSTITAPTVDRNSGTMMFLDNRAPFKKDLNQIANIRTLIKF